MVQKKAVQAFRVFHERWSSLHVLLLLGAFLLSCMPAHPVLAAPSPAASAPILVSEQTPEGTLLTWEAPVGQHRWSVVRYVGFADPSPDTIAIATTPRWLDRTPPPPEGQPVLYRVIPWEQEESDPDGGYVMESFERGVPLLLPYGDEDEDPEVSVLEPGSFADPGHHLHLAGDTWKRMPIQPVALEQHVRWRVDAYCDQPARMQAVGVSDGENDLWYVLWGTWAPNSDSLVTSYQGWFEEEQWHAITLPVGEDWHGRFGYEPTIEELLLVNDASYWSQGSFRLDNIRELGRGDSGTPRADFAWQVIEDDPDSITVAFSNLSFDPDSEELELLWCFGDGTVEYDNPQPLHRYPRGGRWIVDLRVRDETLRWDTLRRTIHDPPYSLPQGELTITCVGDMMFGRDMISDLIQPFGMDHLFQHVAPHFAASDLVMGNLECPMTDSNDEHPTKGIVFKGRPEDTDGLVEAGFDLVTIANNHILDYMTEGMEETQENLEELNLPWVGADMNLAGSRAPVYMNTNGTSIAVVGMSNRDGHYNNYQPFLDAAHDRAGFAPWNRTGIEATVPPLARSNDLVMCQVHCGSEYSFYPMDGDSYRPPSDDVGPDDPFVIFSLHPDSSEVALRHYAIDQGADLVICHHPHVIQGVEVYDGGLIAHSLGNFVFDLSYNETLPSMLLDVHIEEKRPAGATVFPLWIEGDIPVSATGELARNILDYLTHYSRLLGTHLVRPSSELYALVQFDSSYATITDQTVETLLFEESVDGVRSPALPLDQAGYLTAVEVEEAPASLELRFGRDVLLWGNMEEEGAEPWNLNSAYENYTEQEAHGGQRSLRIALPTSVTNNYITDFRRRVKLQTNAQYSFSGWLMTSGSEGASFQVGVYSGRDDGYGEVWESAMLSGDNGWTHVQLDIDELPENGRFLNVRCNLDPPSERTATAYYDDVKFIEWTEWSSGDVPGQWAAPMPNGYRFVQLRATSEEVEAGEEWPVQLTYENLH